MININFAEEEMKILDYERYHHPHPRVQRRMEALLLKSQNISHNQICRITAAILILKNLSGINDPKQQKKIKFQ
ncbi:MAG: hypothetical protein C5S48_03010 [Candidatus Methanogaster sp.]|nr:MAG: hypothetical protein C5S48_03010 [ANME-2 cluster archaeon]